MGHSFTVTSDTDVPIWCNESQLSFEDTYTLQYSSEKNLYFSKIYTMYIEILYTYYLFTTLIMFFKYILN